jgi:hypothetical protein
MSVLQVCCDAPTANGFDNPVRAIPDSKFVILLVTVHCMTATWTQVILCHRRAEYNVQQVTCNSQRSPSQIGALPHSRHVVGTKV